MTIDNIAVELNEIKSSISKIIAINRKEQNFIKNDYDMVVFLEKYIKNRKMRSRKIDSKLFINPGWDILVELFYAKIVRKTEYISSIVCAGGSPPTTGLRYLVELEKMGYVEREKLIHDRRRVMVSISDKAFVIMKDFFITASRG